MVCLEKVIVHGGTATHKGAKIWKRKFPDDMYDSDDLRCCIFLPNGEKNEIPLFIMDPKTTLIQFYIQGIDNHVSVAFVYAGFLDNKPSILIHGKAVDWSIPHLVMKR